MSTGISIIKKGTFYSIRENETAFIMEDKTKRGLTVKEKSIDKNFNVEAEKGMIHDMDGIGHWVPIRWFFPKKTYSLEKVIGHAEKMDQKYKKLRELTCPEDED